ncbi:MAG: hypothetical protein V1737_06090 [Chloroflexota bacterium]
MTENMTMQLLNPAGVMNVDTLGAVRYPDTLEGKTVLMRWNGKHNGNAFLNRIAELLVENVKGVKIVNAWQAAPETATISASPDISKRFARKLADLKPDISIGSQAD